MRRAAIDPQSSRALYSVCAGITQYEITVQGEKPMLFLPRRGPVDFEYRLYGTLEELFEDAARSVPASVDLTVTYTEGPRSRRPSRKKQIRSRDAGAMLAEYRCPSGWVPA